MSRYIEKKYKLNSGEEITFYYDENRIGKVTVEAMDALIERLNNSVEVIRCKYCKHKIEDDYSDGNVPVLSCKVWDSGVDAYDYCSYGERAEDEANQYK